MHQSANLDALRASAVLLVVFSHLLVIFGGAGLRWDVEVLGRVGVAVFFVHTCLVLMHSLERGGGAALPFYVRRAFRIYPLSIAVVLLAAFMVWRGGEATPMRMLASNLLLIQNITGDLSQPAPLWSLPYEVQMYLFLPALYALTRRPLAVRWLAALWAGAVALLVLAMALQLPHQLALYVPCFLPGVLAYAIGRRRARAGAGGRVLPAWSLAVVVGAGVLLVPLAVGHGTPEAPCLWVLCLMLGLTIPLARELHTAWLASAAAWLVRYSFGIYLTHLLAIKAGFVAFADRPLWLQWLVFAVVLGVFTASGHISVERRGIALGARLAQHLQAGRRLIRA